jgi:hypothetical protein
MAVVMVANMIMDVTLLNSGTWVDEPESDIMDTVLSPELLTQISPFEES